MTLSELPRKKGTQMIPTLTMAKGIAMPIAKPESRIGITPLVFGVDLCPTPPLTKAVTLVRLTVMMTKKPADGIASVVARVVVVGRRDPGT